MKKKLLCVCTALTVALTGCGSEEQIPDTIEFVSENPDPTFTFTAAEVIDYCDGQNKRLPSFNELAIALRSGQLSLVNNFWFTNNFDDSLWVLDIGDGIIRKPLANEKAAVWCAGFPSGELASNNPTSLEA